METIKIATLNINGITSRARVDMPENFLRVHDIDILFAQGNQPRNNEHRWIRDTPQHWISHARHSNIGKGRHYSHKRHQITIRTSNCSRKQRDATNQYIFSIRYRKEARTEYFLTVAYHIYYEPKSQDNRW